MIFDLFCETSRSPTRTPNHVDSTGVIARHSFQPIKTAYFGQKPFLPPIWINFVETKSDSNYSDSLSKPTGRIKFYEHSDIFMGRKRPLYSRKLTSPEVPRVNKIFCSTCNLNPLLDYLYGDTTAYETVESLDPASAGRCESLVTSE